MNDNNLPASTNQSFLASGITGLVSGYFFGPESGTGLGQPEVAAVVMSVPETAVNENYGAASGKNQIRRAWQVPAVEPVPEALRMQKAPYSHFWSGVLAPDARHHPAAGFAVYNINHEQPFDSTDRGQACVCATIPSLLVTATDFRVRASYKRDFTGFQ